jgi:hypothetical protein
MIVLRTCTYPAWKINLFLSVRNMGSSSEHAYERKFICTCEFPTYPRILSPLIETPHRFDLPRFDTSDVPKLAILMRKVMHVPSYLPLQPASLTVILILRDRLVFFIRSTYF